MADERAAGEHDRPGRYGLRAAGRADETARRAVEALGRATKPVLRVLLDDATTTGRRVGANVRTRGGCSRDETDAPMRLLVENISLNRGLLTVARLHRTDGFRAAAKVPLPRTIGTTAFTYEHDHPWSYCSDGCRAFRPRSGT